HNDYQRDDAPSEGEKNAKRQKTSKSSKSARGSLSKQSVVDEDEVILEDETSELIEEFQNVRCQCSQNISWVRKGKGLFGPNGGSGGNFEGGFGRNVGSCGGIGGGGSIAGIGRGSLAKRSMKSNDGLSGRGFVVVVVKSVWMVKFRGEVKGSGVDFGVSRTFLSEIPSDIMKESDGEAFRVDGGAD
nr:hypothetical protein [Tanacetum cinerariifolium]